MKYTVKLNLYLHDIYIMLKNDLMYQLKENRIVQIKVLLLKDLVSIMDWDRCKNRFSFYILALVCCDAFDCYQDLKNVTGDIYINYDSRQIKVRLHSIDWLNAMKADLDYLGFWS